MAEAHAIRRNAPPPYRGGCLCGAVRYVAAAPTLGARICHCATCRAAMAAPYLAQAQFPRRAVSWEGTTARWRSSDRLYRHFCPRCGTRLFLEPRDAPRLGIPLATLDDPAAIQPEMHVWTCEALPWALGPDALPRYPQGSPLPYRKPAGA
ncbi:GFA family protein [Methylobacterium planeticum]|uniref:GFA family protein n=2 Tax=Methylobacterium planeticum TaxID=2615211 RepID=A0A6N6MQ08_9HYPH|nr:GFA family protein [Methylobacterium planeticum]